MRHHFIFSLLVYAYLSFFEIDRVNCGDKIVEKRKANQEILDGQISSGSNTISPSSSSNSLQSIHSKPLVEEQNSKRRKVALQNQEELLIQKKKEPKKEVKYKSLKDDLPLATSPKGVSSETTKATTTTSSQKIIPNKNFKPFNYEAKKRIEAIKKSRSNPNAYQQVLDRIRGRRFGRS